MEDFKNEKIIFKKYRKIEVSKVIATNNYYNIVDTSGRFYSSLRTYDKRPKINNKYIVVMSNSGGGWCVDKIKEIEEDNKMNITVTEIRPGTKSWFSLKGSSNGGEFWYSLSPKFNLTPKIGDRFDIKFEKKASTNGKVTSYITDIKSTNGQRSEHNVSASVNTQQRDPIPATNYAKKDLWIARMNAEKCAADSVTALAHVFNTGKVSNLGEVADVLENHRLKMYNQILKEITEEVN